MAPVRLSLLDYLRISALWRQIPLKVFEFDRLRLLAGAPQKFGTQWRARDGGRELWPVDPATTDSERAKWGLPPLAELRRRADG